MRSMGLRTQMRAGRGYGTGGYMGGGAGCWQEVLQEPVGFTFASAHQTTGSSLRLLTSVASVSSAGKWVQVVSPTSGAVGMGSW